ncbi:unnamed protein product [Linum tenue]|uniref:Cytochrome P450 n=1 Tax=Linum tenue TaxID=586396 RepID=A0AAV0PF86_9ROSI|nr:unnamed protein product [Linum tenue]
MIRWIGDESGSEIQVARFVFLTTFNLLGNLMLSRDLLDPKSAEGKEFFTAMMGLMEWGGHANVADIFPVLSWMDPQGLVRKMRRDLGKALEIASRFVSDRIEDGKDKKKEWDKKDFLDVLLEFQGNGKDEPDKIAHGDINIFILEIFLAGSETTSSTTEWALTELLRHPESMAKVKTELREVVGPDRKLEESDIDSLPFLRAVVKETFRLHPPIPLLVPRRAIRDTKFMGYDIPKDTQVFVNAWSIGRDPDQWVDPWSFKPERFLDSKVDYAGQHYQFLPFGAGRRMCAGVPLAHRVLHLILGTLLHEFSWESKVDPMSLNMDDRLGITMRKSESLMVVPTKDRGLRKKMDRDLGIALGVASKFVRERITEEGDNKEKEGDKKDFLDVMLEFRGNGKDEPDRFTEHQINIFILEIFLAGSETSSSTIEWAMTELLRHPESMSKLKSELDKVVGPDRKVEESDIDDLPFLQSVIKETFRLHPPLPLLVPRRVEEDAVYMGYHVPKGTQVLVNAWAIGRDAEAWGDDAWGFKPERFLGSKVDFRGQHHQLIPFGAGRRVCAGLLLAHRMVHLVLGTLVHEFNWELTVDPKDLNMDDRLGVTMRRFEPLMAVAREVRG